MEGRSWEKAGRPSVPRKHLDDGYPVPVGGDRPFRSGIRQAVPQPSRMFSGVVLAAQYQA